MNNYPKQEHKILSNVSKELIIISIFTIIAFILAAFVDAFEKVYEWSVKYESYEIDELFTLMVIMSFAFGIFSLRRCKELSYETTLRKRTQEDLQKSHDKLERRVGNRTAELSEANKILKKEISERKRVEEALQKREYDYRTLFDSTINGLLVIDAETKKIVLVNQAIMSMFGLDYIEEVVGVNPLEFIAPKDKARAADIVMEDILENNMHKTVELKTLSKSSREIWISATGKTTEYQGRSAILISIRDITESKLLDAQLRQAQKMEGVGQLAGGIAHDFNNFLTAIQGNTELAMMKADLTDSLYMNLKRIRSSTMHSANLTRQLLIFSRKQPMDFTALNVNRTIDDFLTMLRRLIGENITIETDLEPDLWSIHGDAGNFEQLIMNLAVNARDAMHDGGKLIIKTENVTLDHDYTRTILDARPGRFVRLSVDDTGIGMDKETIQHIFEPFFSTKNVGEGTGLGLSVVYGIAKEHKGWINVYSEPGFGTTFKVYFPSFSGKAADVAEEKISLKGIKGNGERILLVEDEDNVREMTLTALKENGYSVFEASTAKEAKDLFFREEGKFQLILSDVVLPDENGVQLMDYFLSQSAELKILMCSGYTDKKNKQNGIQKRGFHFIQKPYSLPGLFRTMKDILKSV